MLHNTTKAVTETEKEQALEQTCISLTTLAKQQVIDNPKKFDAMAQGTSKPSFYRQKNYNPQLRLNAFQKAYENDNERQLLPIWSIIDLWAQRRTK
jgi:hypothetical protein